jgi:hypothetical protein
VVAAPAGGGSAAIATTAAMAAGGLTWLSVTVGLKSVAALVSTLVAISAGAMLAADTPSLAPGLAVGTLVLGCILLALGRRSRTS